MKQCAPPSGDVRWERLLRALRVLREPVVAVDARGLVRFCNPAFAEGAGVGVEALLETPIDALLGPSALGAMLDEGEAGPEPKAALGCVEYALEAAPIREGGRIVGAVAVLRDLAGPDAAPHARIGLELDAIIESSFDGIYVCDGTGRTIRVNQAYERITGIRREDVLGRDMRLLMREGFFNESVTLRVLESRRPETLVQKNKVGKTVMVTGNPFFNEQGDISLVVTNVRDVTELYGLQSDLERMENLRSRYESELDMLRGTCGEAAVMVGRSREMRAVRDLAVRLAQVGTTVLVQGESGVGKEVVVDLIHARGPRRDKPLVKVSCAAIPEQLLESELFGYAPGAFTGASRRGKAGLFEVADGGTLFLDEIGDLPRGLQAKLLRALQQQEIVRVGSSETIPVDVRIIAATNRDLKRMVEAGEFRKDLYFRLQVVPVTIPPLRERQEDIIPLAYHFLDRFNAKYGFSRQFGSRALGALADHDWPGNVRELENTVERLVVTTPTDIITSGVFPEQRPSAAAEPRQIESLKAALDEAERRILEQALQTHGSTRKMARALGIDQSTVVRKLRRHGLN